MKKLKQVGAGLACFLPVAIHAKWISPVLWAHGSSAAFDGMVALWFFTAAIALMGVILIADAVR